MKQMIQFTKIRLPVVLIFLIAAHFTLLHANPNVITSFPDGFETDDTAKDATCFNLNAITFQMHNFHKKNDADWVSFYASQSLEAVEIKIYDPGEKCDTVITLYNTDGTTVLRESRHAMSNGTHLMSWRPDSDGLFYVKITNKHQFDNNSDSYDGTNTTYKLWIYSPAAVINGRFDGIITHGDTDRPVKGVLVSTLASETVTDSDGYYYVGSPAGTIGVKAEKPGYHDFHTTIEMGENQRMQLDISLQPEISCQSSYEIVQWGERGVDSYYCVDICDPDGNVYPGLVGVACGECLNTWSPKHYVNIILGVPDNALSGLRFMWKIWSRSGYGGEGFEGTITVP